MGEDRPVYNSKNSKKIKKKLSELMSGGKYSYDASNDSVYSDYKTGVLENSKKAAVETSDYSKSVNGGYKNTYADKVSNNSMHRYNAKINELVPSLAKLDFEKYKGNRQNTYNSMNVLTTKENREYGRYRDDVSDWEKEREYELEKKKIADVQANADWEHQFKEDELAYDQAQKNKTLQEKLAKKLAKTGKKSSSTSSTATQPNTSTATTNQYQAANNGIQQTPWEKDRDQKFADRFMKKTMPWEENNNQKFADRFINNSDNQKKSTRESLYDKLYGKEEKPVATSQKEYEKAIEDTDKEISTLKRNIAKAKESYSDPSMITRNDYSRTKGYEDAWKQRVSVLENEKKELEQEKRTAKYEKYDDQQMASIVKKEGNDYHNAWFSEKASSDDVKKEKKEYEDAKIARSEKKQMEAQRKIDTDEKVQSVLSTIKPDESPYYHKHDGTEIGVKAEANLVGKKAAEIKLNKMGYDGKTIVDTYQRNYNEQLAQKETEEKKQFAKERPFLASVESVPFGMEKSIGALAVAGNTAKNFLSDEYTTNDYNSFGFRAGQQQNAIREEVSREIAGTKAGEAGAFLYQTGMSMADSLANRALFGEASTIVMGMGAASDTAREAAEKGLSEEQVALTALAAGTAEWMFETVELEQLNAFKSQSVDGIKTFVSNMGKQMINEGAGEGATDIMNAITDNLINGGASDYAKSIETYMSQGMSFNEAKKQAAYDLAKQVGMSALGGALSGGIMGAGYTALGLHNQGSNFKSQEGTDAIIQAGLQEDTDSKAYQNAAKLQEKVDAGKNISNAELAMQQNANINAINKSTVNDVNDILSSSNEENTKKSTVAFEKAVTGENINTAEAKAIQESKTSQKILSTLSGETINGNSSIEDIKNAAGTIYGRSFDSDEVYELKNGFSRQEVEVGKNMMKGEGIKAVGSNVNVLGTDAKLKGVYSNKSGNIQILVEDSKGHDMPIDLEDITPSNSDIGTVLQNVSKYGTAGATGYLNGFDGSMNAEAYTKGYNAFYEAGATGTNADNIHSIYAELLPDSVKTMAYANGVNDAKEFLNAKAKNVMEGGAKPGAFNANENTNLSDSETAMLKDFAEKSGVNIQMVDDENANGYYQNGTIYISNSADNKNMVVALHEYTHHLEKVAPKEYKAYRDAVIEFVSTENRSAYDEMSNHIRELYENNGVNLTQEALMNEIAANATESFLSNPDQWQKSVTENKTFGQKLRDFINSFIEYLKEQFGGYEVKDESAHMLQDNLSKLEEVQKLWNKAFEVGSKNTTSADEKDIRYSLKDTSTSYRPNSEYTDNLDDIAQEQLKLLKGYKISETQLKSMAGKYIKKMNSTYDADTLAGNLRVVAEYMNKNYDKSARNAMQAIQDMAKRVIETSREVDSSMKTQYKELLDELKTTKIRLSDDVKSEIASQYDSYNNFRKKYFGKIRFTNDGIELDSYYQDLSGRYPELFPSDLNDKSQAMAIADAIDAITEPIYYNLTDGYDKGTLDEMSACLAGDMFKDFMTTMDPKGTKVKEKYNRLKYEYDAKLKEYRKMLEDRYDRNRLHLQSVFNDKEHDMNMKYLDALARRDEHTHEMAAKKKEQAEKARYKKDARKIWDDLNKRLAKPEGEKYIPKDMMQSVVAVCKEINFDTGYRGPNGEETKAYQKLLEVERMYDRYQKSEEFKNTGAEYNEETKAMIGAMVDLFKKEDGSQRTINELSSTELEQVVKILSAVHKSITEATKLVGKTKAKESYQYAAEIIKDIQRSKGYKKGLLFDAGNKANGYVNATLTPERFFRRLVGYNDDSPMMELYHDLDEGEMKARKIQMEGEKMLAPVLEGKENAKRTKKMTGDKAEWVDVGLVDEKGNTVLITPAMKISLYLHSLNNGNVNHIQNGGFKVPDRNLYNKGDMAEAYNQGTLIRQVPESFLKNIEKTMTPYEKQFAAIAKRFFNDYSRKLVNKTSLQLNGFEKARVNNYFPIRTDSSFLKKPSDQIAYDFSIENSGFLKSRQTGSRNPLLLEDVNSVIERQLKSISQYAGLAIPLSNFNKVMNVTLIDYAGSMKEAIGKKWGTKGQKYIDNMIADLNNARKADDTGVQKALASMRGNMAQAVLTLNPSVTMKQAASYPTAAAVVGYGPLAKALVKGGVNGLPISKAKVDLINKYTGEYWYRAKGNSTQELGDLATQNTVMSKVKGVPILGSLVNSIQVVDLATTGRLWDAAEYYVQDNFNYKKGTDSYYRKTAEIYNKIIHDTQPNYTVLQRPDILRSKDSLTKALTMFMTQRLQNGNILYDSVANYQAKLKNYKKYSSEKNMTALKTARVEMTRAITSQALSALVLSSMTLLSRMLLHKMNPYRDDKKQITDESTLKQFAGDALSSIAGSFLGGSELYTALYDFITGDRYYGITENFLGSIESLVEDSVKAREMIEVASDPEHTEEELKQKILENVENIASDLAQLTGAPLDNMKNILNGVMLHIKDAQNGEFGSFEAGNEMTSSQMSQMLYESILSENKNEIEKYYNKLIESGKSTKQIDSSLATILCENEDTIQKAGDLKESGNVNDYVNAVLDVTEKGFKRDVVLSAVDKYLNKKNKQEGDNTEAQEYSYDDIIADDSSKKMYDKDMLYDAIDSGNVNLINNIKEDYIAAKKAEYDADPNKDASNAEESAMKSLKNNVSSVYKEKLVEYFMDGNTTKTKNLKKILSDSFGYDDDDFRNWVGSALRERYKEAYESNNQKEMSHIQEKAESIGYSPDTIYGWSGKKVAQDMTDGLDKVIKSCSDKSINYDESVKSMVNARDERYQRLIDQGKTEWEAKSAIKSSMTSYYKPLYKNMSAEDRNRLQNMLNSYFWYGKSAKKSKPYDYSKWLVDDGKEEEEKTLADW